MPRSRPPKTKAPAAPAAVRNQAPQFSPLDRLNAGLTRVRDHFGEPDRRAKTAVCAAMGVYFFWFWFASFGDRLAGDDGDSRFIIVILEHWCDVFLGRASFRDPRFFFPVTGVLGYSEPFFLHSLPYALFRAVGAGPYLAFHLMQIVLHVGGYWAALALLERTLFPRSWAAVTGAFLFTASAMQFATMAHAQMGIVAVLPAIGLLVLYGGARKGTSAGYAAIAGAGLLTALVAFSGYYVAFFFGLGLVVAGGIAWLLYWQSGPTKAVAAWWKELLVGLTAAAIGLIPAVMTFLPALQESGGRPAVNVLPFIGSPLQWLNPDYANVWHGVFRAVWGEELALQFGERVGFPWGTLLLFALSLPLLRRWGGRPLLTLALSSVVLLALATLYGTTSPWLWITQHVPGGQGIRVPGRISTIVMPLMIPVCLTGLIWLNTQLGRSARVVIPLVVALWIAEQTRMRLTDLSLREEKAKFAAVPAPPAACQSFYIVNRGAVQPIYVNIDAMLISMQNRIPTLNGYSGIEPRGWTGLVIDDSYPARMERWAADHQLHGVCAYDFAARQWTLKLR